MLSTILESLNVVAESFRGRDHALSTAHIKLQALDSDVRITGLKDLSRIPGQEALHTVLNAFQAYAPKDPEFPVVLSSLKTLCVKLPREAPRVGAQMIELSAVRAADGRLDISLDDTRNAIRTMSDILKDCPSGASHEAVDAALRKWCSRDIEQLNALPTEVTLLHPNHTAIIISDPKLMDAQRVLNSLSVLASLVTGINSAASTDIQCQLLSNLRPDPFGSYILGVICQQSKTPAVSIAVGALQVRWREALENRGNAGANALAAADAAMSQDL